MIYTSDRFTWDATRKTLTACASDLGLRAGEFPRTIEIRNRKVAAFRAFETEKAPDGELVGVRYTQLSGPCVALILND